MAVATASSGLFTDVLFDEGKTRAIVEQHGSPLL